MIDCVNKLPLRLSIVFLNYNRLEDTILTLSVLERFCRKRRDIEVIAVDNGSSDGTRNFLSSHLDWITAVFLDSNMGIEGLNMGFSKACGDYILVLDDDSHPLNEVTLELLIDRFDQNEKTGIIACRIESKNGDPQRSWHLPEMDEMGESLAFVGCGFAVRRTLFERIGWFPGNFFLYQNEIDVAIKVVRDGFEVIYDPMCRVVHRNSPAGRAHWRQVFFPTRNTIWLLRRYAQTPELLYYVFSRICFGFIRAVQSSEYVYFLSSLWQGLTADIDKITLSRSDYRRFMPLWHQNSIFHHLHYFYIDVLVRQRVKMQARKMRVT
ncbi:MAG: glycosyltransferase [Desulfamplus sp.]|nr:glycosyltransferase [Desulfamplus sp.]